MYRQGNSCAFKSCDVLIILAPGRLSRKHSPDGRDPRCVAREVLQVTQDDRLRRQIAEQ